MLFYQSSLARSMGRIPCRSFSVIALRQIGDDAFTGNTSFVSIHEGSYRKSLSETISGCIRRIRRYSNRNGRHCTSRFLAFFSYVTLSLFPRYTRLSSDMIFFRHHILDPSVTPSPQPDPWPQSCYRTLHPRFPPHQLR